MSRVGLLLKVMSGSVVLLHRGSGLISRSHVTTGDP